MSDRSNGAKISNYKPNGEQKVIFFSSSDKLTTRIDLAISPTHSGVNTSNTQNKPKSNRLGCRIFNRTSCITYGYFFRFQITLRRSGAIGYSLNFGTFGSNFGTSGYNFETFLSCTNPLLRAPPK